jgi:hypothetical protein
MVESVLFYPRNLASVAPSVNVPQAEESAPVVCSTHSAYKNSDCVQSKLECPYQTFIPRSIDLAKGAVRKSSSRTEKEIL